MNRAERRRCAREAARPERRTNQHGESFTMSILLEDGNVFHLHQGAAMECAAVNPEHYRWAEKWADWWYGLRPGPWLDEPLAMVGRFECCESDHVVTADPEAVEAFVPRG